VLACAVSVALSVWDTTATLSDEEVRESRSLLALLLTLYMIPPILTVAAFLRRNWGRIALATVTALGLLSTPLFIFLWDEIAGPLDAETLLYSLADGIVILLLFLPLSNAWYRNDSARGHRDSLPPS